MARSFGTMKIQNGNSSQNMSWRAAFSRTVLSCDRASQDCKQAGPSHISTPMMLSTGPSVRQARVRTTSPYLVVVATAGT